MKENVPYTIVDKDIMSQIVAHLDSVHDTLGFDVETDKEGRIVFIQIYSPVSEQTFIFRGDDPDINKLTLKWSRWEVVGHNLQFDLAACLRNYGSYPKPISDTFLLACSLQEDQKGLKPLCNQYFGFPLVSWEGLFGDYDYSNMTDAKWHYIANDPYYTYLLLQHYQQVGAYLFVKDAHNIDLGAMLAYMESSERGIQIDMDKFNYYLDLYTQQVDELQSKLDLYAGWEVRTTSTKDMKKLLFEQMGMPLPPISTEKGEVSVSKEALSFLPDTDGIITLIGQIKESRAILSSMKSLSE